MSPVSRGFRGRRRVPAAEADRVPPGQHVTMDFPVLSAGSDVPARLLYSSRTLPDVIYRAELDQYRDGVRVIRTLTRSQPPGWTGYSGRVNAAMLTETAWPASRHPLAFICGPTSFVEAVAENLIGLGYRPERVKTERFGGT